LEECHPIELLINLVISEQMDPWDIDIVKITERFLREINRMRELNLKFGGKFLLATSFLLRLKSESLLEEKGEDEELPFESETLSQEEEYRYEYKEKSEIKPIPIVKREGCRKTTLFELIAALQQALSEEVLRRSFRKSKDKKIIIKVKEKDIKEKILDIHKKIEKLAANGEITFSELVMGKPKVEIVEILLALLFLYAQGKIYMHQFEPFGEIFIRVRRKY